MSEVMFVQPTLSAQTPDYDMLSDSTCNGLICDNAAMLMDEIPNMLWDANVLIEGSNLVIEGSAGPSGFGSACVKVPLARLEEIFPNRFWFYIEPNEHTEFALKAYFKAIGWKVKE